LGGGGEGGRTFVNDVGYRRRRQKSVVFGALLLFGLLLFMLQIWLFVAVLENLLAGNTHVAIPAAVASIVILLVNIWMLRGIDLLTKGK
jgi:hypothetical protein